MAQLRGPAAGARDRPGGSANCLQAYRLGRAPGGSVPRRGDGRGLPALARQLHRPTRTRSPRASIRSRSRARPRGGWHPGTARTRNLRTLPQVAAQARRKTDMYEALFDLVLTRIAPERAHAAALARSTRSPAPAPAQLAAAGHASRRRAHPGRRARTQLPLAAGSRCRARQGRRAFRGTRRARFRVRRGRDDHAAPTGRQSKPDPRSRPARPRPAEPHGLSQQRRRSRGEAPRSSAVTDGRRRQRRQEPRHPTRAGRRRLRGGGADRGAIRGLPGAQRQLAEHARAARPRVGDAAAAAGRGGAAGGRRQAAAGQDQPGSERRGRRRRRRHGARARARRDRRDQHDAATGRAATPAADVAELAWPDGGGVSGRR